MTAPAAWFACVGLPLATDDVAEIRAMLGGEPGTARMEIRGVAHWHEVGEIIRAVDWDSASWDREEDERQRLWQCAAERFDENAVLKQLTEATDALADAVHGAAAIAAARDRTADPGLVRAASGAALMAAHQNALARLAGAGEAHFFTRRYAIFEGGRWPLGEYRGQYFVF
jgi:hypothetical protein